MLAQLPREPVGSPSMEEFKNRGAVALKDVSEGMVGWDAIRQRF